MPLNNENNNECCKCTTPEIYIELNQQGPQGRQGNPGVDGVSPEITVAQNTNTSYILKIEDANGSFTTPNLKANLPLGGVDGQMLVKLSNEDGVVGWEGNIDNLVTLDGDQEITGNKVFNNPIINGYLYSVGEQEGTKDTIIAVENYKGDSSNGNSVIVGNEDTPTVIRGSSIEAKEGDDYYSLLHQGNVTAGDNITITPTDNGIQIASTTEPYTLPQANATTLGGVKANEKTDEDTQPVNIDPATGLLYTKAGSGGTIASIDGGDASSTTTQLLITATGIQTDVRAGSFLVTKGAYPSDPNYTNVTDILETSTFNSFVADSITNDGDNPDANYNVILQYSDQSNTSYTILLIAETLKNASPNSIYLGKSLKSDEYKIIQPADYVNIQ